VRLSKRGLLISVNLAKGKHMEGNHEAHRCPAGPGHGLTKLGQGAYIDHYPTLTVGIHFLDPFEGGPHRTRLSFGPSLSPLDSSLHNIGAGMKNGKVHP
jgi:hypothetical protein